ncbi:hypothetical protein [Paenarthrobacter aurescens]|uniref:Uncharacterized protein n=1 Tax=Paenarthrobacter aurescens (strain TC1) TaxID=290340 RepID=A1RAI7_PAEAT|nr:hypothetical protein [Paenarthrobacter aurescens]ABM08000.1 hypothetical protein AAur_3556 [Paenarthrobacter aurescens TC1]
MNQTSEPSPDSSTPSTVASSRPQPAQPPGLRAGLWSLALAIGAPIVFMIVFPVGMLFAFGAESPSYVAASQTILTVPTATCWTVAVISGLRCLKLAKHRDADGQRTIAWMFGAFGLCIAGIEVLGMAALFAREFFIT